MIQVWLHPQPEVHLAKLATDPAKRRLLAELNAKLDQLETDPGHWSVRSHRFQEPKLWYIPVVVGPDEYAILWEPFQDDDDRIDVH